MEEIKNKYVAFCDILGFSDLVTTRFEETVKIYKEFKSQSKKFPSLDLLEVSIYSDSILIVGDKLIDVAKTVQILQWFTFTHNWLVRGGIAYGKHWKQSDEDNLFVVSEALVKASKIEKTIKHPIVAISDEIRIGLLDYWGYCFEHTVFDLPIIYYDNRSIVTPFNNYWFKSAEIKLNRLKEIYPQHSLKYDYLLKLAEDIKLGKEFMPQYAIDELLELEKKLLTDKQNTP